MVFDVQFQENEMSPGLSQDFVDGYIKFFKSPPIINWTVGSQSRVVPIKVSQSVVITVGFQLEDPISNHMGS